MSSPREKFGLLVGFGGMIMFAGTLPATRLAVEAIEPFFLTAARAALAGSAGLLLLALTRRALPPRELWLEIFIAGLCTIVGFPVFMALAMAHVPASHGGVVLGILPLATAAAAAVLTQERPSRGFWLASAAGTAIVLAFVIRRNDAETIGVGDLFLIATVICGALGYTLSGRLAARIPGWEVISWSVVIYLPAALIATALLWPDDLGSVPAVSWAGLAYVGFVSQYLAFFAFNAAMAMIGVARVGQLQLLQPFCIMAISVPVNGERLELETFLFAAAVVVTVVIGQRMRVMRG